MINGHFWIENDMGEVIYDPVFPEHTALCRIRRADIRKPQYRPASKERQREMIVKWVLPTMAKKDAKEMAKVIQPGQFAVYQACHANAAMWKMSGGEGKIVYGDMGWALKKSKGVWWEWQDEWDGKTDSKGQKIMTGVAELAAAVAPMVVATSLGY
tara:strand:+ start:3669 stop:4136 length:468 start_codon:yes stop_codon:yes gene_type:complete